MQLKRHLNYRVFDNIGVQAFKHPLLDFLGGPVLREPAFAQFRHRRHDRACDIFDEDAVFDRYLSGEWVYLGPKYHHFGHIMSEMVHRIIPSRILFPGTHRYLLLTTWDDEAGSGFESLDRSYREVLEFCEIDPGQITILNENTIVEHLSLCEQGSNFGGHPAPWYLDVLRDFSRRRLDQLHRSRQSHGNVYVSKSRIPHGGVILGESYVEELLQEEGFLVFHPEESPLSVQMDVYRKANNLVFSEGSACHGTELLGTKMLGRTFVLVRRIETRGDLTRILKPRARDFHMFVDTFLLGTIAVHSETRRPHTEFGVSLLDIDRFVAFFRDHRLARLDDIRAGRYFESAENDLRAYFAYHMESDIADVDAWRIGEVRLEFEKVRRRFLPGHQQISGDVSAKPTSLDAAEYIEERAWAAHQGKNWLEAAQRWDAFRERFPNSAVGFTLGSIALIELGRFYEADALLRLGMERFPDVEEVYSDYALVAHHRRDWRDAVARWESFRAKFPLSMIGYSLGATALIELARFADADSLIQAGLECDPNHEELLEKHAWIAELSGSPPDAHQRWKRLKAIYPNNRAALRYCAKLEL